jgi:Peptidase family S41
VLIWTFSRLAGFHYFSDVVKLTGPLVRFNFLFPLLALMLLSSGLSAQSCNCRDEFFRLQRYMEQNYAGFKDKVTAGNRAMYDSTTADLCHRAARTDKPLFCMALMQEWLGFFRDRHNSISQNVKFDSVYGGGSEIRLTASMLASLGRRHEKAAGRGAIPDIEGIYYFSDSTYKIAIIKNKTADRDYAGVILESRAPTWKPGQVKLELVRSGSGRFVVIAYLRDHSATVEHFVFDGSSFNDGEWFREGSAASRHSGGHRPDLVARQLSPQTFYIGIGSFDESNAAAIDSIFRADSVLLRTSPNLVLDLRGNGGGSDFAYGALAPLVYTDPVRDIGVDVLATADNVRSWSALLDDKYVTGWTRYSIQNTIAAMKGHLGQMIAVSGDRVETRRGVRPFPQRVAVLIDGDCASTTEQFLLEAVQSSKVTLMGRHTAGILDYSNVREHPFDCLPFILHYATTRSRRIDQGKGIDNVGILPAVVLGDDVDWVEAARKYLEERDNIPALAARAPSNCCRGWTLS